MGSSLAGSLPKSSSLLAAQKALYLAISAVNTAGSAPIFSASSSSVSPLQAARL